MADQVTRSNVYHLRENTKRKYTDDGDYVVEDDDDSKWSDSFKNTARDPAGNDDGDSWQAITTKYIKQEPLEVEGDSPSQGSPTATKWAWKKRLQYEENKRKDALRHKQYRKTMTDAKRLEYNEKAKKRMQKYRERMKKEGRSPKPMSPQQRAHLQWQKEQPKSQQDIEKMRTYWRKMKQLQRSRSRMKRQGNRVMEGDSKVDKDVNEVNTGNVQLLVGSEPDTEFYCEECQVEGDQKEADGFCKDCEEYLCTDCATIHRKTKLTRHHILLDKDSMPKKKVQSSAKLSLDSCTDVCPDHRAEIIKYYCDDHDGFACGVCITINHRNCEGISYIPQVAEELETSDAYLTMVTDLQVINQQYKHLNQCASANTLHVETYSDNAVKSVQEIKDQIYNIFELLEHCVQEETEQTKARDLEKTNSLLLKSKCGIEKSQKILSKINELQDSKRLCRLFGFTKEIKRQVSALRSDLEHSTELSTIKQYEFKATAKIKEILRSPSGIGHIVYHETDTPPIEFSNELVNIKQEVETDSYEIGTLSEADAVSNNQTESNESKIDENPLQDSNLSFGHLKQLDPDNTVEINGKNPNKKNGKECKLVESQNNESTSTWENQSKVDVEKENRGHGIIQAENNECSQNESNTRDQNKSQESPSEYINTEQDKGFDCDSENETRHETYTITVNEDVHEVTEADNVNMEGNDVNESEDKTVGPSGVMAEYLTELKIKNKEDSVTPYISGLTLMSSNVILLCDFNNSKLKVFDTTIGILVNDLQLAHGPWDIVEISSDRVAITIPYMNKIYLIKIEPTLVLTKQKEINVKGNCRGIAYKDSKLFVSFTSPPKIEVIGLDGTLIDTVLGEGRAANTLSLPYHVTVNPEDCIVYVSNCNGNDVISLTHSGEINAACQDLKYPRGMCFDSRGFIYVCARDSHVIHVITPECRQVKVLLNQKSGLHLPMSLYVNQQSKTLYVGMEKEYLNVYKLN